LSVILDLDKSAATVALLNSDFLQSPLKVFDQVPRKQIEQIMADEAPVSSEIKLEDSSVPAAEADPVPVQAPIIKPKVEIQFYQTESDVVVSLLAKKLNKDDVNVEFSNESFRVKAKLADGSDYEKELRLAKNINVEACSYKVLSTKIEIRLRKLEGGTWASLEATDTSVSFRPCYPSSSKKKMDWDKVEKELATQEKDDPDSDINSLFSKIYSSGDENTKKAMIKSMQESGGTVLSTNWEEVGKKHVDVSPPDGMEYKKWE